MRAIKIIMLATLFIFIQGCSIIGDKNWSAYKVILEVQDEIGNTVSGANVISSSNAKQVTDVLGRSTLYYTQRGLHIITVNTQNMFTKQVKVKIPEDNNKIVTLSLRAKS